ncbi:MAG: hypothetical protein ACRDN0_19585 [Trebonia sp.]
MQAEDNLDTLGYRFFGIGRPARIAAMRASDELRSRGIAAAALFKPALGGWIIQVYPGGIRQREQEGQAEENE